MSGLFLLLQTKLAHVVDFIMDVLCLYWNAYRHFSDEDRVSFDQYIGLVDHSYEWDDWELNGLMTAFQTNYNNINDKVAEHSLKLSDPMLHGQTPLHIAIRYGLASLCQLLLDKGADVNATDEFGSTALHSASRSGRSVSCLDILLRNGADIFLIDQQGYNALRLACFHRNTECVFLLLEAHLGFVNHYSDLVDAIVAQNRADAETR